tara:strand:- start:6987 stop:8222 length:1236 start_codon:yes stop_codon:yes gene_type:complete
VASPDYDVVVGGAGIVGATLALALARLSEGGAIGAAGRRPLKIALIEPKQTVRAPTADAFDSRVVALTEASRLLLDALGIWSSMNAVRVCPYTRMYVRDGEGTGCVEFDSADVQQPNLGHIVENSLVQGCLMAAVECQSNIDLRSPDTIRSLSRPGSDCISLALDTATITASLLVVADGAQSRLRDLCGFEVREWGYGHQAIVATVRCEQGHQFAARQWFSSAGPLAFLPLQTRAGDSHEVSIVWSQVTERSEQLMALTDAAFCQELTAASERELGSIEQVSRRFSFPLRQCHAVDYVQPRVALIGDAAHTIHPLAGLGVNLGLSDVSTLCDELRRSMDKGVDVGTESALRRYQRRRKPENLAVMAAMEGFKRLFESDQAALRLLRNLGMSRFNRLAPLKNFFIRQAMGLG